MQNPFITMEDMAEVERRIDAVKHAGVMKEIVAKVREIIGVSGEERFDETITINALIFAAGYAEAAASNGKAGIAYDTLDRLPACYMEGAAIHDCNCDKCTKNREKALADAGSILAELKSWGGSAA